MVPAPVSRLREMETFIVDFRIGFQQPTHFTGRSLTPDLPEIKQLSPPLFKNLEFPLCHHLPPQEQKRCIGERRKIYISYLGPATDNSSLTSKSVTSEYFCRENILPGS